MFKSSNIINHTGSYLTAQLRIPVTGSRHCACNNQNQIYCYHVCMTYSSEPATCKYIPSEQTTILQVVLDNDICDCIKHELDVVSVRSTCEVSVDLFLILPFVKILKLQLDIRCGFFICIWTLKLQFGVTRHVPYPHLNNEKCQVYLYNSHKSIIISDIYIYICAFYWLTCIFRKANSQRTFCYFLLKQILFIQKQDYWCFDKPFAITDRIKQLHRFNHPIHFLIFRQN